MADISKEQAVQLPKLPEWSKQDNLGGLVPSEIRMQLTLHAQAAFKLGRNAGLDEAKQACMANAKSDYPVVFADAIESLKDNTL